MNFDIDDKELEKMCSAQVVIRRLHVVRDAEDEDIKETKAVLDLSEGTEESLSSSGESIRYTSCESDYSGDSLSESFDASFINDDEELSCEEFFYENPYCKSPIVSKLSLEKKKKVVRADCIDSDGSDEEYEEKANMCIQKRKQTAIIEKDHTLDEVEEDLKKGMEKKQIEIIDTSGSLVQFEEEFRKRKMKRKQVAFIESDSSSEEFEELKTPIKKRKRIAVIESDSSSEEFEGEFEKAVINKRPVRIIESDCSSNEVEEELKIRIMKRKQIAMIESDGSSEEFEGKFEKAVIRKRSVKMIESDCSSDELEELKIAVMKRK